MATGAEVGLEFDLKGLCSAAGYREGYKKIVDFYFITCLADFCIWHKAFFAMQLAGFGASRVYVGSRLGGKTWGSSCGWRPCDWCRRPAIPTTGWGRLAGSENTIHIVSSGNFCISSAWCKLKREWIFSSLLVALLRSSTGSRYNELFCSWHYQ